MGEILWQGSVVVFDQPGSYPRKELVRIVDNGGHVSVEQQAPFDAMGSRGWIRAESVAICERAIGQSYLFQERMRRAQEHDDELSVSLESATWYWYGPVTGHGHSRAVPYDSTLQHYSEDDINKLWESYRTRAFAQVGREAAALRGTQA